MGFDKVRIWVGEKGGKPETCLIVERTELGSKTRYARGELGGERRGPVSPSAPAVVDQNVLWDIFVSAKFASLRQD